jgi:hypothetical protein
MRGFNSLLKSFIIIFSACKEEDKKYDCCGKIINFHVLVGGL